MRLKPLPTILFVSALLASSSAFAWNATGHEIIARIAWDNLTPDAKAQVTEILRQHPDYARALTKESTPAGEPRDKEAFLVAATWPDLIRSASFGKSHITYNHPIWHYVDMPFVIGDAKAPTDLPFTWTPGKDPENVVQAIKKNVADLQAPATSPADRAAALAWVEHLVGDIHQPLHTTSLFSSEFPDGDKGGNSEMIKLDGRVDNLHYVWDSMLGGYMDLDAAQKIAESIEHDHPRQEFQKQLTGIDPERWTREGHEEADLIVYLDGKLKAASKDDQPDDKAVPELPPYYLDTARGLAAHNAALAGYRLADALNALFAKNP